MARTRKSIQVQNLYKYDVLIEERGITSEYFKLSQFDGYLYGGRNAFLVAGSTILRPSTKILVEVLNKNGNAVYSAPVADFIEGNSRLVRIEVYEDTPIGPGKIVLLGCADTYIDGTPVPTEWQGKYNIRWITDVIISPRTENKTPIRFNISPSVTVAEKFYYAPGQSVFSQSIQEPIDVTLTTKFLNVYPNGYALKINGPNSKQYTNKYLNGIITGSVQFSGSNGSETASINLPITRIYNSGIAESIGNLIYTDKQNLLQGGFISGSSKYTSNLAPWGMMGVTSSLNVNYNELISLNTGSAISYVEMRITDLSTISGDVYKTRISYKSTTKPNEYVNIADVPLQVSELLTVDSGSKIINVGKFSDVVMPTYWYAASMSLARTDLIQKPETCYYSCSLGGTLAINRDSTLLLDAINVGLPLTNGDFTSNTKSYFIGTTKNSRIVLYPRSEYTLSFEATATNITGSTVWAGSDDVLEVYLLAASGSSTKLLETNPKGQLLGTLIPNKNSNTYTQNFETVELNFTPQIINPGLFDIRFISYGAFWNIANVSIKPAEEPYFSPDEVTLLLPNDFKYNDILTFQVEYLDVNNNSTGIETFSLPTYFTGSSEFVIDALMKFNPAPSTIVPYESGSYLYVSSSDGAMYFTQIRDGFNTSYRLLHVADNLYTGLFYGGVISALTTTTYTVSAGRGVIVNLNADATRCPLPEITYIEWPTITENIAPTSASADQQFISINKNGQIIKYEVPCSDGQYNTEIPLGVVIHQNRSTINAVQSFPSLAYGWKQRSADFIRAFGPLKLSGFTLSPSGLLGLTLGSGTAWSDGRNYTVNPNNPSYISDMGTSISKIYKYSYYSSGSGGWNYDTNNGTGYTVIDPTKYSNNSGSLAAVKNNEWTCQRVFWFPNSVTKAFYVYYGNVIYDSLSTALANYQYEPFVEAPNTAAQAVQVATIIIQGDGNFSSPTTYQIVPAGLFRSVGGSGGGSAPTSIALDNLADVSIVNPKTGQTIKYNEGTSAWQNSDLFPYSGSAVISGSVQVTGSLTISGSSTFTNIGPAVFKGTTAITGSTYISGPISASMFTGSAMGLTSIPAENVTGTFPSTVLGNSSVYVGTTSVALNRASAALGLTGISSIGMPGGSSGTVTIQPTTVAGTTTITLPATTGTVITSGDTGTVTNTMLAGSIANNKLTNSTISGIALGSNLSTLTLGVSGTGLSGSTTYNGSTGTTFTVTSNATNANTASTIVARDGSGNFSAGTITAALSGNASTATTLQTARNINGVSFNGSADITVTAAAGTLTGNTLASGVTASSLTSVGTLTSLSMGGNLSLGSQWLIHADTNRNPNADVYYPNSAGQAVRFSFSGASYLGMGGNYGGVLHFHPWDGKTSSTGDASYQLAFGSTAVNGSGYPQLAIRNGIDTNWNSWYYIPMYGLNQYTGTLYATAVYDSNDTTYYMDYNSTTSGKLRGNLVFNDYGAGVVGTFSSYNYQNVFSMGASYVLPIDGTTTGTLYGIAWSHPNAGGAAANLASHGMLILENGSFRGAWGGGRLVTTSDIRGTVYYDYNDTNYYIDPASTSIINVIQLLSGGTQLYDGTGGLTVKNLEHSSAAGILGIASGGQFEFQLYGEAAARYGFLNGVWAGWDLRKEIGGAMYFNGSGTYYLQPESTSNFNAIQVININGTKTRYSVYDSSNNFLATPTGMESTAAFVHFTGANAIAPYSMYRSSGDWPPPYGIGWSTGGESSGILQKYSSNGVSLGEMIFYTGNDGYGSFVWRRHTWEGTTYQAAGSNNFGSRLAILDWNGNFTADGAVYTQTYYDSNDTGYYTNPASTSNLNLITSNTITTNAGYSFVANGYNDNGGFAMNNTGTYWGLMWNYAQNDWRLGWGSQKAQVGWNMRWDNGGNAWSNSSHRAPIFYDANDTAYYMDGNNGTALKYLRVSGNWGSSPFGSGSETLTVTGEYASICQRATNGRLGYWLHHLSTDGVYYLYGGRGTTDGSDWDWSQRAFPQQDGSYVEFRTSARAPIFYHKDDTGYYIDPRSTTNLYRLDLRTQPFNIFNTGNGANSIQIYYGPDPAYYHRFYTWYDGSTPYNAFIQLHIASAAYNQNLTVTFRGNGNTDFENNIWIRYDCSALTFTDRTPYYEGDALSEIKKIKGNGKGEIDHTSLPSFARKKITHGPNAYKHMDKKEELDEGRDLGAMISILTVAVQQLTEKVEKLESKIK